MQIGIISVSYASRSENSSLVISVVDESFSGETALSRSSGTRDPGIHCGTDNIML